MLKYIFRTELIFISTCISNHPLIYIFSASSSCVRWSPVLVCEFVCLCVCVRRYSPVRYAGPPSRCGRRRPHRTASCAQSSPPPARRRSCRAGRSACPTARPPCRHSRSGRHGRPARTATPTSRTAIATAGSEAVRIGTVWLRIARYLHRFQWSSS